jgi:transcriptional regulator with XRE-family HTH domain
VSADIQALARHLAALRAQRGMTQKDVAARMNITRSAVAHLENDLRCPRYDTVLAYCRAIRAVINIRLDEEGRQ